MGILDGLTDEQKMDAVVEARLTIARVKAAYTVLEITEWVLSDSQALAIARHNAIRADDFGVDEATAADPLELPDSIVAKASDAQLYKGDGSKAAATVNNGGFIFGPNFDESEYVEGQLARKTAWSANDSGTFKWKYQENLYTYDDNRLMSEIETIYNGDGSVRSAVTYNYYTTENQDGTQAVTRERA